MIMSNVCKKSPQKTYKFHHRPRISMRSPRIRASVIAAKIVLTTSSAVLRVSPVRAAIASIIWDFVTLLGTLADRSVT